MIGSGDDTKAEMLLDDSCLNDRSPSDDACSDGNGAQLSSTSSHVRANIDTVGGGLEGLKLPACARSLIRIAL